MTRIVLAFALIVAALAPAHARWVRSEVTLRFPQWEWRPDRPMTWAQTFCLARVTRGLDAGHFPEAELECSLRHGARAKR